MVGNLECCFAIIILWFIRNPFFHTIENRENIPLNREKEKIIYLKNNFRFYSFQYNEIAVFLFTIFITNLTI